MLEGNISPMMSARWLLALCSSICSPFFLNFPTCANSKVAPIRKNLFSQAIGDRQVQFTAPLVDRQPLNTIVDNYNLVNSSTATERWYGGFGIGISSPTLNSNGQISGFNLPFKLDVDTNNPTVFNVVVGKKFSNFRAEGEILSTNNSLRNASFTVPAMPSLNGRSSDPGNISSFSLLLNGYYDLETGSAIKPFIGAGVGYSSTNLDASMPIGGTTVPLKGSNSGFTYQLKVGASYAISDRADLYLQYRYINSPLAGQASGTATINGTNTNISANVSGNLNASIVEFGTRFGF